MSLSFPSLAFFEALQEALAAAPECVEGLDPCEAYCGLAIEDALYVLEFDGRACAAVVRGGNELDLDFVVAGPVEAWRRILEAVGETESDTRPTLAGLVDEGALEVRSSDDDGPALAAAALPFLQVFLERAAGLDVKSG